MKIINTVCASLLALAICVTCYAADGADICSRIEVESGKEFIVTLPSNPTTGYSWELASPVNEKKIAFVGSKYITDDEGLVGSGGKDVWTFKALQPGKTRITLRYVRPWAKKAIFARKARFFVVIR